MALSPSNLISKILSPALRLWLRSQVEQAEELEIQIQGQDRQILRGYVPEVSLQTRRAIYQGLRLGQVLLQGENIRINIGQVVKGKPLQLLEPIQVSGEVQLTETDLQDSLSSTILANALTELLIALLERQGVANPQNFLASFVVKWRAITLGMDSFSLEGTILFPDRQQQIFKLCARLILINSQSLLLKEIRLEGFPSLTDAIQDYPIDLGTDVAIASLTLRPGELACVGQLLIRP